MEISPFVVCQSTAGILGTSFVPGQRGRRVLVSRDTQALDVYSVDANKVTRSWTMRPGTTLDHRAVFLRYCTTSTDTTGHDAMDVDGGDEGDDDTDLPPGAVMAVADSRTLLYWDSKDATLGKAKKVKTNHDIHSLYGIYDHAVVICTDLSIHIYDAKGRVTYAVPAQVPGDKGTGASRDHAILFADVSVSMGVDDNSSADVTVVITVGKGKKKEVRVLRVTLPFGRGQEEASVAEHVLECNGAAGTSGASGDIVATTCQSQGGQAVYLVWSNGDVSLYDLQLSDSNDAGELTPLRRLHTQDALHSATVACCVPGGYLALISSVKGGATLWVYDVTYGSLQGSVDLHAVGTNATAKKAIARSSPVAVEVYKNNVIVISLSHAVVAANMSCPPVTLAHALATQRRASSVSQPTAVADTTLEPLRSSRADADVYLRTPGVVQVHKGMEALEDKETSVVDQLRDSKQTSNEAAFLKVFNKYVDTLDIRSAGSAGGRGGDDDDDGEVTVKPTATLSHHFIATVVTRCIQSSFTQPLLWLFNTRRFSAAPFDDLTQFIIEQNDLALLEAFLLHVRDIREIDLVHIIQYVITTCKPNALRKYIDGVAKELKSSASAKGGKRGKKGGDDDDDDDEDALEREARASQRVGLLNKDEPAVNGFLSLVVSVPRNDRFLVSALRTLTLQESLTLMNYLSHWYKRYTNEEAGVTATRGHGQRHPSFFQVLDWATLLIDARFSELILVPECHGFILQLRQLTNANKQMCESVSTLKGFLHELLNGNGVPSAPVPDYSLEIFELK